MSYVDREDPVPHAGQQSNELIDQTHYQASTHSSAGHNVQDFLPDDTSSKSCPPLAADVWENSGSQYLLQDPSFLQGCQPIWMDQLWDNGSALGAPAPRPLYAPVTSGDTGANSNTTPETWNSQAQMPIGSSNFEMFWPNVTQQGSIGLDATGPPLEHLSSCGGTTFAQDAACPATVPPASLDCGRTAELDVPSENYPSNQNSAATTQLATISEHGTCTPDITPSSSRTPSNATTTDSQANLSPASSASTVQSSVNKVSPATPSTFDQTKPPTTQRRQRNRVAASRCRARTTQKESDLEAAEREARSRNESLRGSAAKLREEMLTLRQELLEQASVPNCKCVLLRRYLKNRARVLCVDDDEEPYGHGEEEHFMAGEDSDGDVAIHSPHSDIPSWDRFGGAQEEEGRKQQKSRESNAGKRMAEQDIAGKGAWGTDKIPLVVDFSMAPAEKHPEESIDVKGAGVVLRRTSARHGTKRKSAITTNVVDLTASARGLGPSHSIGVVWHS